MASVREGCSGECQIVTLRYHAGGEEVAVTEQTDTGSGFGVGDPARVRYDPRRPDRAQLLTEGSSQAGFFACMVVFSAVLAALGMPWPAEASGEPELGGDESPASGQAGTVPGRPSWTTKLARVVTGAPGQLT